MAQRNTFARLDRLLRDQVFVHQPLLVHVPNDGFHLVNRVEIAEVMPADKLPDVAVQVLLADLVERPLLRLHMPMTGRKGFPTDKGVPMALPDTFNGT